MRYTYEFKKHCVDLYRKGQYPKAPEGIFPFSPEREIFRKLSYTPTYNYEQSS